MTPNHARASRGERAVDVVPSQRGENISVVAALTAQGLEAPMMVSGSMNGLAFQAWVEQELLPILESGMVVFMDNVRFHLGGRVRELIEGAGCVLAFLPKYSPDLNAIEEAFSKVKTGLRRLKARDWEGLVSGLADVVAGVSAADVLGWVGHAGYQVLGGDSSK